MAVISPAMMDEIERRKERVRRVWHYQQVDHIPIMLQVRSNPWGYTTREHFLDGDKQFQLECEQVRLSLAMVPDDYIPSMRPDVGCIVIESALGALDTWRGEGARPAIGEVHVDPHGALTLHTYDEATAIQLGVIDSGLAARMRTFDAAWAELSDTERARARAIHLDTRPDHVTVAFASQKDL